MADALESAIRSGLISEHRPALCGVFSYQETIKKRVHWHRTAGAPGMIAVDADSYHKIIQPDGTVQRGRFVLEANIPPLTLGGYAAHTRNANSFAIGIACDAMAGAQERPLDWGSNPLSEAQIEVILDRTAYYCRRYDIPVSRQTTLSYAEAEKNRGIKQRNKWDFMNLPGMTRVDDPVVIGDEPRRRLTSKLKALDAPPVLTREAIRLQAHDHRGRD